MISVASASDVQAYKEGCCRDEYSATLDGELAQTSELLSLQQGSGNGGWRDESSQMPGEGQAVLPPCLAVKETSRQGHGIISGDGSFKSIQDGLSLGQGFIGSNRCRVDGSRRNGW